MNHSRKEDPIFVLALPRSGSTLLIRLLNKCRNIHDDQKIYMNGENETFDLLKEFYDRINQMTKESPERKEEELIEDKEFLSHYHYTSNSLVKKYIANIYLYWAGAKKHWGWKEVNYGQHGSIRLLKQVEALLEAFPNTKLVFLDREIEECAVSMVKTKWFSSDINECKNRLNKQMRAYQMVINKYRSLSHVIGYETLINYDSFNKFAGSLNARISKQDYEQIIQNRVSVDPHHPAALVSPNNDLEKA